MCQPAPAGKGSVLFFVDQYLNAAPARSCFPVAGAFVKTMLMETVYFENDHLTLYYNLARKMGRAVWTGFLSGEVFRSNTAASLQLIADKNPVFWLADNRKMKAIRQKDQAWLEKEILPRLAGSSIQKMATLVSEDIFNQMAVETLFIRSNHILRFDHQFFHREEEARTWLTAPGQQKSQGAYQFM
jgi:hypothetical protein